MSQASRSGRRPSVAFLVDDLAAWQLAGRHPTGIQRVADELLRTAWASDRIDAWPAVVLGVGATGDHVQLGMVDRDALAWDVKPGHRMRALALARRLIRAVPLPHRPRTAAKSVYRRLSLRVGHLAPANVRPESMPDILVIPGSFWGGDLAASVARLARSGHPPRIMVFDLLPITHPEWFTAETRQDFCEALDLVVPLADRIVTLSSHVADEVGRCYPTAAAHVRVAVPRLRAHAPRTGEPVVVGPRPDMSGPFLLALTTVEPRKNHRIILDAWRAARQDRRLADAWLVVAGGRGWLSEEIEAEIAGDGDRLQIRRLEHLRDADIEQLYAGCHGTIHASWDEGFGLPARESVARGIPTLLSTGIPADGLPAGSYRPFDPSDASALAAGMVEILVQPRTRLAVQLGAGTGWEPVLSALTD